MGRFSPPPDELLRLTREYHPPRVNVGDEMQCEIRGLSIVRDWHDAPIMWPVTCERHKRRSLIVTGDLLEALRVETVSAIQHHWGVGRSVIARWKQQLKIGATARTREIRQGIIEQMADDECVNERRREVGQSPERIAFLRTQRRGERQHIADINRERLLSLPICPVCRQRRSQEHIAHHVEWPDGTVCRQCGGRWVPNVERPGKCKRCSRTDWDRYPCPVCGDLETGEHAIEHLRGVGATSHRVTPSGNVKGRWNQIVYEIPGRSGEYRSCVRCKAIRPDDMYVPGRGRCAVCRGEQDSRPRPCPRCGATMTGYRRRYCDGCKRKRAKATARRKYVRAKKARAKD